MGNDRGSIPDRRELVRNKPKVSSLDPIIATSYYSPTLAGRASRQGQSNSSEVVLLRVVKGNYLPSDGVAPGLLTDFPQKPLQEPIVSCALGKLYNKDALLEYLLDRTAYGDGEEICGHIRSLKVRILDNNPCFCEAHVPPGRQDSEVDAESCEAIYILRL